jgi:hypothetical protein
MEKESAVPLSNVKRIFRSQYKTELSETALGYSKLSELLRDPYVSDLCIVELQRTGYAMIPRPEAFVVQAVDVREQMNPFLKLEDEEVLSPSEGQLEIQVVNVGDIDCDITTSPNSDSSYDPMSESTATPTSALEIGNPVKPKRRRPQMMENIDDDVNNGNAVQPCPAPNSQANFSQWSLSPSKITQASCVGGMIQRTFIHHPPPPPTPGQGRGKGFGNGSRIRSLSVPKDFGSPKCVFADALHSLVYLHRPVHSMPVSEADDASSKCDSPDIESLAARPNIGPVPTL